jgi:2-polyprenyl-6-methoxyphenol hydroxylase-like FAD-dependent oxidoreductase
VHQNIPTGGHGMNTAVGDSFDIGWKISAVLHGYGGPSLLRSYDEEWRPVAARNLERSGVHWSIHGAYIKWCVRANQEVTSASNEGKQLWSRIAEHVRRHDSENMNLGIELGYRYNGSSVFACEEPSENEPS